MKRKLFLLLCTLLGLLSSVQGVKAYTTADLTAAGWTEVTSTETLSSGANGNVYVLVDAGASTYFVTRGANLADMPKYVSLSNPFATPGAVWTLESRGTNKYAMRNLSSQYYLNSSTNGYNDFMDASWTNSGTFDFAYSSNWEITNTSVVTSRWSPGQYMGPWDGGTSVTHEQNVACNKDQNNAPGFKIYSISRATFATQYLTSASSDSPMDATFLLVNPNIHQGGTVTSTVSGWTATGTTGNSHVTQGTNDTRLEAWHWVAFTAERSQVVSSLPSGYYAITAAVHSKDNTDPVLFISSTTSGEKTIAMPIVEGDNETPEQDVDKTTDQVYVPENGSLTFGIKIEGGAGTWFTGDNFKLKYYGDPLTSLQKSAKDDLNDANYTNVTGAERTALEEAATMVPETAAAGESAVASVQEAIDNFVAAKTNYDALASVNAKITAVGTLEYASSAKKLSTYDATSSSDAASHATSLTTALRAYVESNALAEGVAGATDCTDKIAEPSCAATVISGDKDVYNNGTWTCVRVRVNGGEGYTNASGITKGYYFDSNGTFWGNTTGSRTASISQTVSELPAGKYLLTVTARKSANLATLNLKANNVSQAVTNPNGVFGNSWDDTSVEFTVGADGLANISVEADKGGDGNSTRWFSADNFRLVRIENYVESVTIGAAGYATFGSQYPLDLANLPDGLEAFKATGTRVGESETTYVTFQSLNSAVAANTGLLLKGTPGGVYNIPVAGSGETVDGNLLFVNATGTTFDAETGYSYFGLKKDTKTFAPFTPSGVAIPANKAYLRLSDDVVGARMSLLIGDENDFTAINAIEATEAENSVKDGKFLIDGKIVIVKNGVKYGTNGQKLN